MDMHRVLKFWFPLFCLSILTLAWTATGLAQYLNCTTPASAPDSLFVQNLAPPYTDENLVAEVTCFVHVLREDDGSGGLSSAEIDSMLGVARQDLSALGVTIVATDQSDLLNSTFYANPDSLANEIFAEDIQEDAINIYLGPAVGAATGVAQSIPGTALLLSGVLDSYSALSHLLGHCLGLYNTNETVFGVEAPNGSNGATTGDLVADTAADPGLQGWVESDCELAAAFADSFPDYAPDATNIMSEGRMSCWSTFTEDQRMRVASAIQSYKVLTDVAVVSTAVYLNATETTTMLGQTAFPVSPTNAVAFDFDGDGMKDILVSGLYDEGQDTALGYAGKCREYTDNDVPVFDNATGSAFAAGSRPRDGTPGLIAADYDNDGHIDFYAPNPEIGGGPSVHGHSQRLYHNTGAGGFADVTSAVNLRASNADWDETIGGAWGDYDGDGYLDLLTVVSTSNTSDQDGWSSAALRLYHNYATAAAGRKFRAVPLDSVGLDSNLARVRSVFWVDIDQDHDMDLITIQYTESSAAIATSRYYLNTGGMFSDVTSTEFKGAFLTGQFCAAPGDLDNDGDVDIAYHGQNDKGWVRNDLDGATGQSTLHVAWNEHEYIAPSSGWPTEPQDLDILDFDQDGSLDIVVPNMTPGHGPHRLLRNEPSNRHFTFIGGSGLGASESFGMGAADFSLDGYTDLVVAPRIVSRGSAAVFFKAEAAFHGASASHWIGIRLEDTDSSCNYRGIGATVIITAGSHTQAQVVDGGSGRAGQHDLDLSFGLGSYSGTVDVKVIWPCGQTQYEHLSADQYHTITLTKPEVINSTVARHLEFGLGENTLNWKFEWDTTTTSNNALDWVEFPSGLPDSDVTHLDAAMADVEIAAPEKNANGTYHHCVTWLNQECVAPMSAPYKVHSKVIDFDFPSSQKTLKTLVCPRSE
jgi:hypothetical protein